MILTIGKIIDTFLNEEKEMKEKNTQKKFKGFT